jgi:glutamyl-tRNA synthetase
MPSHLAALTAALATTSPFDEPHVETAVRGTAAERGIKAGSLIHGVRVGLTGRTASPGLFEMMALLGREETIARLNALLTFLAARK